MIRFTQRISISKKEAAFAIIILVGMGGGTLAWLWHNLETSVIPNNKKNIIAEAYAEEALRGIAWLLAHNKTALPKTSGAYRIDQKRHPYQWTMKQGRATDIVFDDGLTPDEAWYELAIDKRGQPHHAEGTPTGLFRILILEYLDPTTKTPMDYRPDVPITLQATVMMLWNSARGTQKLQRTTEFIPVTPVFQKQV